MKDVSDAARAAFALAVAFAKPGSSDASDAFPRGDERADWLITRAFAWEATASALVFFSANGSRTGTRSEAASERVRKLPNAAFPTSRSLDVAAVRDALARALDPSGLIAAVAETDAEQAAEAAPEAAARAVSTSAASFRLGSSLSMFSPVKKNAETTRDSRDPPEVAGSSSYGSAAARDSPASSLPGSPSRPKEPNTSGGSRGHSRSHSFSSLNSSSKSQTSDSWAPAAESRLRAAAADAVAPFALFARSERADDELARRDARPLPATRSRARATPRQSAKTRGPRTRRPRARRRFSGSALEASSPRLRLCFHRRTTRPTTATHRLTVYQPCSTPPPPRAPRFPIRRRRAASRRRTTQHRVPRRPPRMCVLRRALNPADAPLGPWHGEGSDAAGGSPRRLEGAADDSAVPSPWRERHARSGISGGMGGKR